MQFYIRKSTIKIIAGRAEAEMRYSADPLNLTRVIPSKGSKRCLFLHPLGVLFFSGEKKEEL